LTYTAATPNNTSDYFLYCIDPTNLKIAAYSNGTISNRTGTFSAFSDIKLKRQHTLDGRVFDLLIGNKILLEFDEDYHKYIKDIDIEKNKIGSISNLKVLRINSNCDYGLEISKIYKMVKNELY